MHIVTVTKDERDLLAHSLGLTASKVSYRNYFNAEPGHGDMPIVESLIAKGLMFQNPRNPYYYHVSDAGYAIMGDPERI